MDSALPKNTGDAEIKRHVQEYYSRLFEENHPRFGRLPIKMGKELAEFLGYPISLLPSIPQDHWEKFLPCGNPFPLLSLRGGDRLLNLGCGAAVDSFLIQEKYGCSVEVVNLDIVYGILQRASSISGSANCRTKALLWICADGECLPFGADSFDWILMNGALNLFPKKSLVLREVWRVLKPSGFLIGADLCAAASLPDSFRREKDAWAWCMSGACTEIELTGLFNSCGFKETLLERQEEQDLLYRIHFSCQK